MSVGLYFVQDTEYRSLHSQLQQEVLQLPTHLHALTVCIDLLELIGLTLTVAVSK